MVDDYSIHRVSETVQRVLNPIIWDRQPYHIFKLSAEKYGVECVYEELSNRSSPTADLTREFREEDCGRLYIDLSDRGNKKELFTFSEYNANKVLKRALEVVKEKNICSLVSDAGMPVISDPGYQLINKCWEENIEIDIIPGPNAPAAAIALSGFPGSKYMFHGFLPRGKNKRRLFRKIKDLGILFVFFESPQRLNNTLKEILEIVGDRDIFIAREMTKIHQELFRGKVSGALKHFSEKNVKGEITIVLSGKEGENESI